MPRSSPSLAQRTALMTTPARLVIEAGGCVVGIDGPPLPAATVLTDGVCLIAAASRDLCDTIVDCLHRD